MCFRPKLNFFKNYVTFRKYLGFNAHFQEIKSGCKGKTPIKINEILTLFKKNFVKVPIKKVGSGSV